MTHNNRSEISLDTGYLPCGFAYISRHRHHTVFQVFTLADIEHFGLLSPPCTFPGIQIIRHSEYRFFCTFFYCRLLSLWVTSAVTSNPHFSGIWLDPFYLLPVRRLQVWSEISDLRNFWFHAMCSCTEQHFTYQIRWEKWW